MELMSRSTPSTLEIDVVKGVEVVLHSVHSGEPRLLNQLVCCVAVLFWGRVPDRSLSFVWPSA